MMKTTLGSFLFKIVWCFSVGWVAFTIFGSDVGQVDGQSIDLKTRKKLYHQFGETWYRFGGAAKLGVEFNGLGNPIPGLEPGRDEVFVNFNVLILNAAFDSEVQQELDIVDHQIESLKGLVRDASEKYRHLPHDSADRNAANRDIHEIQNELIEQLADVFLPHQYKALNQLAVRKWINELGWIHVLNHSPLTEYLDLSAEQRSRISDSGKKLLKHLSAEARTLEQNVHDRLLENLSPQKKAIIQPLVAPLDHWVPELDMLEWNLHQFVENTETAGRASNNAPRKNAQIEPDLERLSHFLNFGSIFFSISHSGQLNRKVIQVYRDAPMIFHPIVDMLKDPFVAAELRLSSEQKKAILKLWGQSFNVFRRDYSRLCETVGAEQAEPLILAEQAPFRQQIVDLLNTRQQSQLKRILYVRQCRLVGLPQMIAGSIFGIAAQPTKEERQALRQSVIDLAKEVATKKRELARSVENELCGVLNQHQRVKLQELIGNEPPKFHDLSLDLIFFQLEFGDRPTHDYYNALESARNFRPNRAGH